jgi:hypothetical protein
MSRILQVKLVGIIFCCLLANVQAQDSKHYAKEGLSFDYPAAWQLQDETNGDAQQLTLAKADSDVQIRVFVHRGRITAEKLPGAKKAFIDPYIAATAKQFVDMGAKPEQVADSSEIGGVKAEGTSINASLGGEAGAAKIYWALVGQRVVVLTLFGPDKQMKQLASAWELVRTSLKVVDPGAAPAPSPKATP